MIKAEHKFFTKLFFDPYIDTLLKSNFSHFYLANPLPVPDQNRALVIIANHISWWDGFFIYPLLRRHGLHKIHLLMLEEQLRRFSFFSGLGAFSITPGNRHEVQESLAYISRLLAHPQNAVILYPQGEIQPYWQRPAVLKKGITHLFSARHHLPGMIATGQVQLWIAAFAIHPYDAKKPEIWMHSAPLVTDPVQIADYQYISEAFNTNLTNLDQAIQSREFHTDWLPVLKGRRAL